MSDGLHHIDLFSGIGGFALACKWNGIKTIQFVEIDKRCRNFLSKAWPGVAIHDDVRTFHHSGRPVYLLTGGVPCQPASRAGKQRGDKDDRWLWPEAVRILGEVKPTWAIYENPPGIGDVGLAGILYDLEAQGYQVRVFGIPACAVGSPQIRMRYWIVGKSKQDRREPGESSATPARYGYSVESNACGLLADTPRRQDDIGRNGDMAEAEGCRRGSDAAAGGVGEHLADPETAKHELLSGRSRARREGLADHPARQWDQFVWLPCADGKVRRAPDDSFDVAHGLHRSLLGALGNSIVPKVAAEIIRAIMEVEA